jgi:hypothetical protein
MADKEHLAILMQGVEAGNKWRKKKLGTIPELSHAHISDANLNSAKLTTGYDSAFYSFDYLIESKFQIMPQPECSQSE